MDRCTVLSVIFSVIFLGLFDISQDASAEEQPEIDELFCEFPGDPYRWTVIDDMGVIKGWRGIITDDEGRIIEEVIVDEHERTKKITKITIDNYGKIVSKDIEHLFDEGGLEKYDYETYGDDGKITNKYEYEDIDLDDRPTKTTKTKYENGVKKFSEKATFYTDEFGWTGNYKTGTDIYYDNNGQPKMKVVMEYDVPKPPNQQGNPTKNTTYEEFIDGEPTKKFEIEWDENGNEVIPAKYYKLDENGDWKEVDEDEYDSQAMMLLEELSPPEIPRFELVIDDSRSQCIIRVVAMSHEQRANLVSESASNYNELIIPFVVLATITTYGIFTAIRK